MAEPLKNLLSPAFIHTVGQQIKAQWTPFDAAAFEQQVQNEEWADLELKARMRHMARALRQTLPGPYPEAISILKKVPLPEKPDFIYLFYSDFVEEYGLEDWETSMDALEYFTKSSTGEFAVRPFILQDEARMMAQMQAWSTHEDFRVRRLASEGCRPRLPWGMGLPRFKKDPALIMPILEELKADDADFVRKSVANNLNDISKDHPELVLDTCTNWQGGAEGTDWIIKHACRGLLKQAHPRALTLFGFGAPHQLVVDDLKVEHAQLPWEGDQFFSFQLTNLAKKPVKVRLEYHIFYQKANGKQSPKVFQIAEKMLEPGSHLVERKQPFLERTTRKHYPGPHGVAIVVNGVAKKRVDFELMPD